MAPPAWSGRGGVCQRFADAVDVCGAGRRRRIGAAPGRGRSGRECDRQATGKTRWGWRSSMAITRSPRFSIDSKANVNQADTQGFTPLFWAVDRRNMETAPNFPWMVTTDPLPLIKKLLDAGANPNALVNNTPRARMRAGSPRIVFATALMRAAFSGDLELVKLLLATAPIRRSCPRTARRCSRQPRHSGSSRAISKGKTRRRTAGGRQAARGPRRRRECGRRLRHYAADGRSEHGRASPSSSSWSTAAPTWARMTWARRTTARSVRASSR